MVLKLENIVCALDRRPVRFLSRHQQMVLAGMHLALSPGEMSDMFGCSESTVIRVRRAMMEEVFDLTEVEGPYERLRLWAERHWQCCTAGAHDMTENRQLLAGW